MLFALLSATALTPAVLPAQDPIGSTEKQKRNHKETVRKRVIAMRRAMREGRVQNYNVFVKVWLKNGNRMKGVVKNGRFVEMHDGLDFVAAASNRKGAGMRVWYTAGTTSYVFVPYDSIKRYKIGSKLSDEQVKAIELKLAKELAETQENYRRVQEARRRKLAKDKGEFIEVPLTEEQSKLLEEFPPGEGWGEEKLKQMKTRRITLGVYPDEKERRFEANFEAWKKAVETKKKNDEAYKNRKVIGSGSGGSGSGKSGKTGEQPVPIPIRK